jgi:23S rRNA pseudoU1915 N3-methylase RlmH
MRATTEKNLESAKHSLKRINTIRQKERKEFENEIALLQKRISWQRFSRLDLKELKERAAKKLAKIEAKQAKEYQELFTLLVLGLRKKFPI